MRTRDVAVVLCLAAAPVFAAADEIQFSESDIRAILAHGPWPASITSDPTNRASGCRAAVELGERLFFDNGEFRNNGFSTDAGRVEGFRAVRASRFNLASGYNDDPHKRTNPVQEPEAGTFKVPTLRHHPWRPEDHGRCH